MKRFVRSALGGLAAVAVATGGLAGQTDSATVGAPPAGTQFVFVNTQAILPQVPGAQEAQSTFNQELQQYQAEVETIQAEVDSLMAAYRRQEAMLTPQVKEQRQQEILQKQQELQSRAAELDQRATARQQELLKPLFDRIGQAVETIRTEKDYTIVFDIAGSGVVAADPSLDITGLVLQRLREQGPDAASASPTP